MIIYGSQNWTSVFELIAYQGVGLGMMIIPFRIFFWQTRNRDCR